MARPKIVIDYKLLEKLCTIQCSDAEIAAVLDISTDTITSRKETDACFSAIYKKGHEGGKTKLRRHMFESAINGNTTMQIWLSKQYLDMKDRQEISGGMSHKLYDGQTTDDLEKEIARLEGIIRETANPST